MKILRTILLCQFIITSSVFAHGMLPMNKFPGGVGAQLNVGGYGSLSRFKVEHLGVKEDLGLSNLGVSVGITGSLLDLFDLGGSISVGGSSLGKLFSSYNLKKSISGADIYMDALARLWLPLPLFELGFQVIAMYERGFSGIANEIASNSSGIGFQAGPTIRFNVFNRLFAYGAVNYSFSNIKFEANKLIGDLSYIKDFVNTHGIEIPIGLFLSLNSKLGVFAQLNTDFENLRAAGLGYKGTFHAGLSFGL